MKKISLISIGTIGAIIISASMSSCFMIRPNMRVIKVGNITLLGQIISSENAEFLSLDMGNPDNPLPAPTPICIEFDSNIIPLDKINIHMLADKVEGIPVVGDTATWTGCVSYSFPSGFLFMTRGDKIVHFSISHGKIWDGTKSKSYEFPLNAEEIKALFGEPDEVFDKVVL